jgi:23S rRNA (cytosine1962-C5)-methyltransferase
MHQNPVEIVEHGVKYMVDVVDGHKTGFYLDQRDNRYFSRSISRGRKILDCFAYTGSFAVNCLLGNAQSVTLVESSRVALEAARKNFKVNNLSMDNVELVEQDVFKFLRTLRDKRETFDLIILDPPKFASTAALAERAARGYKDINLLALKILTKGGYLLTFSCSGGVSEDLFQKIVAGSALDAGTEAVILKRLHQAIDHPVALNFPEGAYLKGFLVQKIS